jgi:poly(A) polymerase
VLGRLVDVYPEARALGERFAAAGHELYLVGGTVRDTLLAGGDASALDEVDLDLATSAHPEETERLLRPWASAIWLTGAEFGTVSCQAPGPGPGYDHRPRLIEITTFRADSYQPGSRHPEVEYGTSIEDDLARRDLTINAMAVRVPDFRFVDPHGGLQDLRNLELRTPIDPTASFGDDPLRMVRLARFASVLDASATEAAEAAAAAMADELATISAERIRDELVKLIAGARPRRGLELLLRTGLSRHVLPELDGLRACQDPQHRHKDVWAHTLAVLEQAIDLEPGLRSGRGSGVGDDEVVDAESAADEPRDAAPDAVGGGGPDVVLRLAALLHDVGKPDTREIHRDGTVTFHHHDVVGARMVRHRMRELRFDKETTRAVSELVRLHLRFHTFASGWTDAAVRRYVRDAGDQLDRLNALTRADVTTGNARKAARIQRNVDLLEERIAELREQEEIDALRPPIDGNAIMAHLGIRPGPVVGEAWQHLLELRIEEGPMDEAATLAALDTWWASRVDQVAPDVGDGDGAGGE